MRVDRNTFVALNTAYFTDGAFVHVPAGQVVEKPVHLLFLSTSEERGSTSHPRNLVIAERDSRLTPIESHVSSVQGEYFTNAVTEFVIGEHAAVEHCKFQDESPQAYHIATQQMSLARIATSFRIRLRRAQGFRATTFTRTSAASASSAC